MKNLTKSNPQPVALEDGVSNMDAKVASKNMQGSAHDMPLMCNQKRAMQRHMGDMPAMNPNGYT